MTRSTLSLAAVLAFVLSLGALAAPPETRAQTYPPPAGSLSVQTTATTPPGSTTPVTATVLDNAGNPVVGAEVTFRIVSQPGTGAQWVDGGLEITAVTDANGVATAVLSAGTAAGTIIVETVSGEKTSQVTLSVQGAELPETGGPLAPDSDAGVPAWQIAVIAVAVAALAGGLALTVRRRGKRA